MQNARVGVHAYILLRAANHPDRLEAVVEGRQEVVARHVVCVVPSLHHVVVEEGERVIRPGEQPLSEGRGGKPKQK